jgi:hypothetical protein
MHSKTPQHVQYAMMLDLALPQKHHTFDEKRAAMPMRIMWLLLQRANYYFVCKQLTSLLSEQTCKISKFDL